MKSTCTGSVVADSDDHLVNCIDDKVRFYQFLGVLAHPSMY